LFRSVLISFLLFPGITQLAAVPAQVHVDTPLPTVPRPLEPETEHAAIRDYLQSWQAIQSAFQQNRSDLLEADFAGGALTELSSTIREQSALGISTKYQDISHNIKFLFYSPEGLSIEFIDTVTFTLQVFDHGHLVATHREIARYLVVMSPAEVRWRVRIFQAVRA
jgi:hypothetical protein